MQDISNLCFVKYGFNWLYAIDFINILYSMRKKMYILAVLFLALYLLFAENTTKYSALIIAVAFIGYAVEIFSIKQRRYHLITSIKAKNVSEAKKMFLEQYILQKDKNIIV